MYAGNDFSPFDLDEQPTLSFSFANDFAPNEAIVSTVWALTVADQSQQPDLTPSARLLGSASFQGNVSSQRFSGMLAGVTYQPLAQVTTSLGNVLSLWAFWPPSGR
jgi:hypothetical protein